MVVPLLQPWSTPITQATNIKIATTASTFINIVHLANGKVEASMPGFGISVSDSGHATTRVAHTASQQFPVPSSQFPVPSSQFQVPSSKSREPEARLPGL